MLEVKERGERLIKRDVLTQQYNLNERQTKALEYLLQHDRLTIQNYEALCPEVNRCSQVGWGKSAAFAHPTTDQALYQAKNSGRNPMTQAV